MLEADDLTAAVKRAEGEAAAEQKAVEADRKAYATELAGVREQLERISGERGGRGALALAAGARDCSSWSRSAATAWPSPKRATGSARSATSACARRCSTWCGATTRSTSATTATGSCTSSRWRRQPRRLPDDDRRVYRWRRPGQPGTGRFRRADRARWHAGRDSRAIGTPRTTSRIRGLLAALEWAAHGERVWPIGLARPADAGNFKVKHPGLQPLYGRPARAR